MAAIVDDVATAPEGSAPVLADQVEVEVKFLVRDLDAVRERLIAAGAQLGAARVYERNVRYDTPDEALLARQSLLRLRQDSRARLTYKGLAAQDAGSEAKIREELEVTADDFDTLAMILARLGFAAVQTYEKYRETWHLRDVEVVLDELPFGDFVELEGPADSSLKAVAARLGLDWSQRILANYLALMELARQTFDLPFRDLTFTNFAARPVDMGQLLPVCVLLDVEEL